MLDFDNTLMLAFASCFWDGTGINFDQIEQVTDFFWLKIGNSVKK